MITVLSWIAVGICVLTIIVVLASLLLGNQKREPEGTAGGAVEVSAERGSVITVRKVGGTTKVEIRPTFSGVGEEEHYEDGTSLPVPSVEVTKMTEPELYREYMSPGVSAVRKYEIIDYVYALGLTLPLIPGLHEQYLKETEGKHPGKKEKPSHKTLRIDRTIADTPMPSMSDQNEAPVKIDPKEYLKE